MLEKTGGKIKALPSTRLLLNVSNMKDVLFYFVQRLNKNVMICVRAHVGYI